MSFGPDVNSTTGLLRVCVYIDEEYILLATGSVVLRTRCQHNDKKTRCVLCKFPLPRALPYPQLRKAADKARNARPWCGDASTYANVNNRFSRGSVVLRTRCQLNDKKARRVSTEMKKVLIRRQARLSLGADVNSTTRLLVVCLQR